MKCNTCQQNDAEEKIDVVDLNFDPPARYYFCSIWCRNFFLNTNKGHIKPDREYGDTTAIIRQ